MDPKRGLYWRAFQPAVFSYLLRAYVVIFGFSFYQSDMWEMVCLLFWCAFLRLYMKGYSTSLMTFSILRLFFSFLAVLLPGSGLSFGNYMTEVFSGEPAHILIGPHSSRGSVPFVPSYVIHRKCPWTGTKCLIKSHSSDCCDFSKYLMEKAMKVYQTKCTFWINFLKLYYMNSLGKRVYNYYQ